MSGEVEYWKDLPAGTYVVRDQDAFIKMNTTGWYLVLNGKVRGGKAAGGMYKGEFNRDYWSEVGFMPREFLE